MVNLEVTASPCFVLVIMYTFVSTIFIVVYSILRSAHARGTITTDCVSADRIFITRGTRQVCQVAPPYNSKPLCNLVTLYCAVDKMIAKRNQGKLLMAQEHKMVLRISLP